MATTVRVTRLANPRRRRRRLASRSNPRRRRSARSSHRRRNTRRRRTLTPKQIRYFGTPKQKAALRASRKRKAARHRARPKTAVRARAANPRRRRRVARRNPALVVTLGAINPKRRTSMARRRRKARRANPRRRRHVAVARRRSRNATRVVVMAPRRRRHNRRHYSRRRRNPVAVFGHGVLGKEGLVMIGGGLLGVAAAKFIPTLIPATLQMGGSTIARVVITGLSAWAASMLAAKVPGGGSKFADAVFFGGLMQTGSVALNAVLPGFRIGGVPIGLSGGGFGELVPGQFSVPQNPLRLPAAPAQARVQMNGLHRVYGTAL